MPENIHCQICGQAIKAKNFGDGMSKLRHHRKRSHPKAFRESVRKGVATRKRRS